MFSGKEETNIYKILVETSNNCIFVIEKGLIKYTNKRLIELSEYDHEELLGKPFLKFIAPEEHDKIKEFYFKRTTGEKVPDKYTSIALTKTGKRIDVDVSIVLTDFEGEKLEYVIMHDITEWKKTEASLKESIDLYQALHENNPGGLLVIGRDYIINDVNKVTCDVTGYKREELIGQFCDKVCPKGKESKECPIWEKGANEFQGMDTKIKSKSGIKKPIIKNAKVITQEGKQYILETFMDITAKKITEEALRESEQYYRTIFETTGTATLIVEEDFTIILANSECTTILGLNPDKLIGKNCLDFIKNDEVKDSMRSHIEWEKLLSNPDSKHELRIINAEGNEKYIIANFNLIPGTTKAVISILDISEIKHLETQYLKAKDKAEESDRLKSAFLANMSHEIRTPMNGIIGFSHMLKDSSLTNEKRDSYIKIINDCGNHLLSIVNDILDISKIETGELKIEIEETDLNSLISEQFELFVPTAEKNKIQYNLHLGLNREESIIKTDPSRLCQIISTLLNNAFKYTHKGNIELGCILFDNKLQFYVKDSGIGIAKEMQIKIFDRFSQIETGNNKQYSGNGLGLAISKKLVELLDGEIWVESTPGKGSEFIFTIPYEKAQNKSIEYHEHRQTDCEQGNSQCTVLVVEDDDSNYLYIKEVLNSLNVKVIHAKNGKEAITFCEVISEINMVLMDIKMPVMSGFEATRQIKLIRPNLPVIAQSAYAMTGDKEKAMQQGFDDYFTKPIRKNLIKEAIDKFSDSKIKSNLN